MDDSKDRSQHFKIEECQYRSQHFKMEKCLPSAESSYRRIFQCNISRKCFVYEKMSPRNVVFIQIPRTQTDVSDTTSLVHISRSKKQEADLVVQIRPFGHWFAMLSTTHILVEMLAATSLKCCLGI